MKKILIIANDESTILNFRREIVATFVQSGFAVTVCYPLADNTESIAKLGCRVENVNVSRHGKDVLKDLKFIFECKKLIKKHRPDIVLTYTVKPNIYASIACQFTKTPYINNVTGLGSILQNGGRLSGLILKLQKIGYRKSSCVFFQNVENRDKLKEKGIINEKTPTVILPGSGVNLEKQKYEPFPKDDGIIRFVFVSRVRADKGYNEFFEAAQNIKLKYPNTEFHVIGWYEEEELTPIVDKLHSEGIIIYHGKKLQEEVHEIEKMCDCLIHPTYHEGMANVILEAAASGRPVIATNIHGCIEAFEEGVTGFGCEVKSAKSLEAAIEKFINTPYEKQVEMGKLARKKMEKEFDRQIVANKYIEMINKTLEEKHNE